jgi:hypothetical protein
MQGKGYPKKQTWIIVRVKQCVVSKNTKKQINGCHLDDPEDFLEEVSFRLSKDGRMETCQ